MQQRLIAATVWLIALLLFFSTNTGLLSAQPSPSYAELEKKAVELHEQGKNLEVIRVSHKMLQAANDEYGRESEEYRVVLFNLGLYYRLTNQLNQAQTYYEKATEAYLTIYDQLPEMPDGGFPPNRRRFYRYEDCLIGSAKTFTQKGDLTKAEELYLKVLDLSQNRRWDVIYWQHLEKTAEFYIEQDQYAEGIKYLEKNLSLIKEHYREDSYRYITRAVSVGYVYHNIGQYDKAQALFDQAVTYFETESSERKKNASYWPERYISTLQGLGLVHDALENYITAIDYYDQFLTFTRQEYGSDNYYMAYGYLNKATVFESLEEYDNQINYLNQAEKIVQSSSDDPNDSLYRNIYTSIGRAYGLKGEYNESLEYLEKAVELARTNFGDQSFEYAQSLYSLAVTYYYLDRKDEAWNIFLESTDINFNYLESNFTTLTNGERTSFWNSFKRDFENIQYQVIDTYKERQSVIGQGFNYLLKTKAYLLQNNSGFNRAVDASDNPLVQQDFTEWQDLRGQIANATTLPEEERKRRGIMLNELEERARSLERSIAEAINFNPSLSDEPITWEDIQQSLRIGEVAIEIMRTREYSDKEKQFVGTHYAAYLLTSEGPPQLIEFPESDDLESRYLPQYRQAINQQRTDEESYRVFWEPIKEHLEDVSTVYFSPDGVFHQISLNTLRNPESSQFLLDEYDIKMVTKTSDIVDIDENNGISYDKFAVLFGRPDYSLDRDDLDATDSQDRFSSSTGVISRSGLSNVEWTDLPGTEAEVKQISSMLLNNGWQTDIRLAASATESAVKKLRSPRILHIATHGFFSSQEGITSGFSRGVKIVEKPKEDTSNETEETINPMMQSGLVLAGVENFFRSVDNTVAEDGILTAFEASGLLLNGTELVVLSACETGLGEISNGEGIYGLKRAFKIAGAESVIMSLWKVNDRATQKFMTIFYDNWLKINDKRKAFRVAQQEIKAEYNTPYYWGAFVLVGD